MEGVLFNVRVLLLMGGGSKYYGVNSINNKKFKSEKSNQGINSEYPSFDDKNLSCHGNHGHSSKMFNLSQTFSARLYFGK